jgi:hypothetical protein
VKAQDFHFFSIFQQLQWNPDLWLAKRERQTILQKEKSRIFQEGLFGIGLLSLLRACLRRISLLMLGTELMYERPYLKRTKQLHFFFISIAFSGGLLN